MTEWKLVPVEPTEEMIDAAQKLDWADSDVRGNCHNQWAAMLAAAPQPPERKPLELEQKIEMWNNTLLGFCGGWEAYLEGIEDAERIHGIK